MLTGFVCAPGAVEEQAEGMVRFGPGGLGFQNGTQVRFGGDVATRPENLGESKASIDALGPPPNYRSQSRLSGGAVALLPAVESRTELCGVAPLFKVANCRLSARF